MTGESWNAARHDFLRWLSREALPRFEDHGLDPAGGVFEALEVSGMPRRGEPKRLRVQARQAFAFARAERLGLVGDGQAASDHAWRYLVDRGFHTGTDAVPAGFIHVFAADGGIADARRDTYDHAFVLLAAAERFLCYKDPEALKVADRAWAFLGQVAHSAGGYAEGAPSTRPRRQNPHMHLLEAALLWQEARADARAEGLAADILALFDRHFWDPRAGVLREFFTEDWDVDPDRGAIVEPGHMVEWLWLLAEAGNADDDLLHALMGSTRRLGQRGEAGLIADTFDLATGTASASCRLWPQTEYVRACVALARVTGETRWLDRAAEALANVQARYLTGVAPGCYHDAIASDGAVLSDRTPASLIYHLVTLADELVRG